MLAGVGGLQGWWVVVALTVSWALFPDERAATGGRAESFPAVRGGRARSAGCKIRLQREQKREQAEKTETEENWKKKKCIV